MDPTKAAKLIRMLSSSNDGEVLNAARLLTKMDIHKVAERVEVSAETVIRYTQPRRTRARAEIDRLSRLVDDLQSQLAKFTYRCCLICDKPFVAGRSDASTCSPRCRIKLHRTRNRRHKKP
jgi:hypothetical protein